MKLLALVVAMVVVSSASTADEVTDTELLIDNCKHYVNVMSGKGGSPIAAGYCLGFMQSMRDANSIIKAGKLRIRSEDMGIMPAFYCASEEVELEDMIGVFVSYVDRQSNSRDEASYLLGIRAFREAWPCF